MDEARQTFCVIGDPIGHSLSPLIHGFVFSRLGLPYRYEAIRVPPDGLARFVAQARLSGRPGFNVTIPHKVSVIEHLDALDPRASAVGAVNTVAVVQERWIGTNTDVQGCRAALVSGKWSPDGRGVVLLGAGGAARAAAEALASLGMRALALYEIQRDRAEQFRSDFEKLRGIDIELIASEKELAGRMAHAGLIVNATPVGMWPNLDASPVADPEWIPGEALVFDMVPNPVDTKLLRDARSRGAATLPGLVMLVAQALAADETWLSRKLPDGLYEDVLAHCMEHMEAHGTASDSHRR
jgi:shikimate dehydrogenase